MYTRGNRVIYDVTTGAIVHQIGEVISNSVPVKHESISTQIQKSLFWNVSHSWTDRRTKTNCSVTRRYSFINNRCTSKRNFIMVDQIVVRIAAERILCDGLNPKTNSV